jgi:hypothetical protein
MSANANRIIIAILGLYTAIIHLVVLNLGPDGILPLFVLNGLGYFALLGALLFRIPAGRQGLVHYAFMAYAAVTIVAWAIMNGDFSDPVGVSTKAVELLLIIFLWLDLKKLSA